MSDQVQKINNSLIQHGPYSNRIYLMKLDPADSDIIVPELDKLASQNKYTKIFAKIPQHLTGKFLDNGYSIEATIPQFYNSSQTVNFLAKFLSEERKQDDTEKIREIINLAKSKADSKPKENQKEFTIELATPKDVQPMSELYKKVFDSYPFPIDNPEYLLKTMKSHVVYYIARDKDNMVALASAELDASSQNAEMTDFATLPKYRGRGLAWSLLKKMEQDIPARNITTIYTIARAMSPGMNITFARTGYKFAGTLIKNTQICGQTESMNIWYKHLQPIS